MAKRKKKDPFGSRAKGVQVTIRLDAELVHLLDKHRHEVEQFIGIMHTREEVLQGLLRVVWKEKLFEAQALAVGSKLSDQIGGDDD